MRTTFCRTVTKDKLRLDGLLFEPNKKSKIAVLHIHGMAGNFYENFFLDSMAKEYTKAGYTFLTANNRGHDYIADIKKEGSKEQFKRIGDTFEKIEDCILDINAWLKFLKTKGYKKFILQGHSLGTVKAVFYLSKRPNHPFSALVLASPPDMLGLVRIKAEKKNFKRDLAEAKRLISKNQADAFLSSKIWDSYYKSASSYLNFFADGAKTDVFPILRDGGFKALESIKIPILAFYGGNDDAVVFSPHKDLEVIKKHIKDPQSKTLIISDAPHSYFKHEKQVALTVVGWLRQLL